MTANGVYRGSLIYALHPRLPSQKLSICVAFKGCSAAALAAAAGGDLGQRAREEADLPGVLDGLSEDSGMCSMAEAR